MNMKTLSNGAVIYVQMADVGDEIRVNGKWLEIHRISVGSTHVVLDCYDFQADMTRKFVTYPHAARRIRQAA